MKKRGWSKILLMGLGLLGLVSIAACTSAKQSEPQYAPEFTLQMVDGTYVDLKEFRPHPVMLTFWRINCSACQFQMPFTEELFNKWSANSITVLTINVGDRAADVKDYVDSRKIEYPILLDTQGQVAGSYGLVGVPTTFFIDGAGLLQAYQIGAFESEKDMERAIKKAFPKIVLSPKTKTSPDVLSLPKSEPGPEIGKAAPDFTLQTTDNRSLSLSDLKGKTVLLNFWMSTCDACVAELPYLQAASDNLTGQQVAILAVNCGESSLAVHSVVDRLNPAIPILLDPDGTTCATYKHGAPTAFLIDSTGIIKSIKDDAFESTGEVVNMLNSLAAETQ
jgi:cytochrome c biogenesis protein CcmG/thiol:disulfide interchange protein DsbE